MSINHCGSGDPRAEVPSDGMKGQIHDRGVENRHESGQARDGKRQRIAFPADKDPHTFKGRQTRHHAKTSAG